MTHLEQQKAEAWDNKLKKHNGISIVVSFTKKELDTLIEATHQAAIEECVRVAEGMLAEFPTDDIWNENENGKYQALTALINAIKSR